MEPWGSASLQSTASGSDHSDDLQALDHRADLPGSWEGTSVSPLVSGGRGSDCPLVETGHGRLIRMADPPTHMYVAHTHTHTQ